MLVIQVSPRPRLVFALFVFALALLALAPAAVARELYAPSSGANTVTVIDTDSGLPIGAPIPSGDKTEPFTLSISPDGRFAYAVNFASDSVGVLDTKTKSFVGSIPVGNGPIGIAISRDGTRGWVANSNAESVSVVDLVTRQVVGAPIPVGDRPENPILNPDGSRLYVPNYDGGYVTVIDTATNQVLGQPIDVGDKAYVAAITPDGRRLFVTSVFTSTVYVIDTANNQVIGGPIAVGEYPSGIAISPDGKRAYSGNWGDETISVIDTQSLGVIGTIHAVGEAEYIVLSPDGRKAFTSDYSGGLIVPFDPLGLQLVGSPIPVGTPAGGPAIVPDQPPVASFALSAKARPGVAADFSAAASRDPDGAVATYAWSFGDGGAATGPSPTTSHVFARPGTYQVALTVTDNEGCSVSYVITGGTAYCNGSPVAGATVPVTVAYPAVRLKCPASAAPAGCNLKVQAVVRKGKGAKRKLKPQSSVTRLKVKAGKSKIVSLKPKKVAREKLARAKKILVREIGTIGGKQRTIVRKLKVIG